MVIIDHKESVWEPIGPVGGLFFEFDIKFLIVANGNHGSTCSAFMFTGERCALRLNMYNNRIEKT